MLVSFFLSKAVEDICPLSLLYRFKSSLVAGLIHNLIPGPLHEGTTHFLRRQYWMDNLDLPMAGSVSGQHMDSQESDLESKDNKSNRRRVKVCASHQTRWFAKRWRGKKYWHARSFPLTLTQLFKDALCERLTTTGDLKSWRKMSHSDWWSLGIPENTGDSDVCKGRPMMQRLAKNAVLYLTTDALTSFRIQVFWGRHHVKSHAGAYWRTFSMKRTLALHQHNTHRCLV